MFFCIQLVFLVAEGKKEAACWGLALDVGSHTTGAAVPFGI